VTKILLVILVTVALVLWFKYLGRKRVGSERQDGEAPARKPLEDMVRCKVCGVNLPRSEALMSKGQFYCCDEHRRVG